MELERNGQVGEATRRLNDLLQKYPEDFYLWFRRATIAISHALPSEAIARAEEFMRKFPIDQNGEMLLAMALMKDSRPTEALEFLEKAEKRDGVAERTQNLKVQALKAMGKDTEAKVTATVVGLMSEDSLEALWARDSAEGPSDEAEMRRRADRFRQLGEHEPQVLYYEANWYACQGKLDRAAEHYSSALDRYPDNRRLNYEMAMIDRRRGRNEDAIRRLDTMFKRDPSDAKIAGVLVQLQKEAGSHIKAMKTSWAHAQSKARSKQTG